MPVKDIHAHTFAKSSILSSYQMPRVIPPIEVIRVLNRAKVSFVLVGLHGLVGWLKEPRGTEDVDLIVAAKHHKRAVAALLRAFPHLHAVDLRAVTRFMEHESETVLIDVIKPIQQPHREIFKHVKTLTVGRQSYRIPSLEMAIALKFAAMTSHNWAQADKFQDAHDFILIVNANPEIELPKLRSLGELVFPTGGSELLEMVRRVRNGERLVF
ncbi:MAG: hypothetical protein JNM56_30800 [Planctomycetia bacterium]|nr:hypothetical protein [Planctomycetia bacterium]